MADNGMKIRRWILLDLWVLSLAAISFYGGAVSYGIFWGITLLPVVSLIYLSFVYFNLKILQQIESRDMVCGQPMPYFFVLQNESLCVFAGVSVSLFSSFSFVEDLPGDTEYELLPEDKYSFETRLTCKYRGEYEVGVKEIIMTDFFRIFRIRYRIPGTIRALVMPKIIRPERLHSIEDLSPLPRKESAAHPTEPDILTRDYFPGDSLKQIHWKATAREQKLKIRNRTGEENQGISLLWDTRRYSSKPGEYLPVENRILEVVLALGIFLAEKNIPFSAYCGQKGIVSSHVPALRDFDSFYRQVSDIRFDREEDFSQTFPEVLERGLLFESRVVFCVLHRPGNALPELAERLDRAGSLVVLYLITDENIDDYIRQGSERLRIIGVPLDGPLEGRL